MELYDKNGNYLGTLEELTEIIKDAVRMTLNDYLSMDINKDGYASYRKLEQES